MSQFPPGPPSPPPLGGWGPPQQPGYPQQQPGYPPQARPGYPQQVPGFTTLPGSSGGGGGGVKALVVALVVLAVAAGAFFLLRDGGSDDPAGVVRDFYAAAEDGDCERMISLVTEASWSQNGTVGRQGALDTCASEVQSEDFLPAGLRIESIEETGRTGDTAEVTVRSTSTALGGQTETIPVVRENGRWVIDFAIDVDFGED